MKRWIEMLVHVTRLLTEAIHPRGHRVFFGALDPGRLGLGERAIRKLPTASARTVAGHHDARR